MSDSLARLKEEIVLACRLLVSSGVLSLSQHGNVSARLPGSDRFLLTGGGSLAEMTPERIALFDLDGRLLEGAVEPASAEIVEMHAVVYRLRPEAGGVLHTHSPYATSWAVAQEPIPLIYEALARFDMAEGVPVAGYGPRGSRESVENIARVLKEYEEIKGLLLANHGVLTFADSPRAAATVNLIIEEAALLALNARAIGRLTVIPPEMVSKVRERRDSFAARGVIRAGD